MADGEGFWLEFNGSQLKNPDISGAIFTLSLSIRILNSQCVKGARDVKVFQLTPVIIFVTNILDFRKNPNCRRITFRRNILCIFLCDWFVDIIICRKVCRSMLHRTHVVSALTVAVLLQLYNSASSPRTIPPFSEL